MCNLFCSVLSLCFFFNDTATTEIYTLSLHDALPISASAHPWRDGALVIRSAGHHGQPGGGVRQVHGGDRHRSGSPRGDDATFCAGLVKLLALIPGVTLLADAGYQGLSAQTGGAVLIPRS